MDADHLIESANQLANKMYEGAHSADRLAYEVGLLRGRIRELCYIYNNTSDELRNVQRQMKSLED